MPNTLSHITFPDFSEIGGFRYDTLFDSLDGWYQDKFGTGTTTKVEKHVEMVGGPEVAAFLFLGKNIDLTTFYQTWDKRQILRSRIYITFKNGAEQGSFFYVGAPYASGPGFGFNMRNAGLYGYVGDVMDQSEVALDIGKVADWEEDYLLEAILTPGVKVDFYVNNVYVASIDVHIPTGEGNQNVATFYIGAGTGAANHQLWFSGAYFYQDL